MKQILFSIRSKFRMWNRIRKLKLMEVWLEDERMKFPVDSIMFHDFREARFCISELLYTLEDK